MRKSVRIILYGAIGSIVSVCLIMCNKSLPLIPAGDQHSVDFLYGKILDPLLFGFCTIIGTVIGWITGD